MVISASAIAIWTCVWAFAQEAAVTGLRALASRQSTVHAGASITHQTPRSNAPAEYAKSLPLATDMASLELRAIETARTAALRYRVSLSQSQVNRQAVHLEAAAAGVPTALDRVVLSLALRGEYPALKSTLDELLQRAQPALLRDLSLALAPAANPSEVEARITILLPLRPKPIAATSVPPAPAR